MLTIIDNINARNYNKVFDYNKLKSAENYINLIDDITYFDHGATALCYVNNKTNTVYKICEKDKLDIGQFIINYKHLDSKGIKVLQPSLIFENSTSFIYSQPKCDIILKENINAKVCHDILSIIYNMLLIGIIYPDLYYRNFGYHNNKCYLFDFHDSNIYNDENNTFYVFGIFSLLFIYFTGGKDIKSMDEIKSINYGKELFSQSNTEGDNLTIFYLFIKNLVDRNFKSAEKNIKKCIDFFSKKIQKNYVQYQYVTVNNFGQLTLSDHTLNKYRIAKSVLNYNNNFKTLLDAGCCIGGIGLKLAQKNPQLHVTLNNITINEISVAKEIKNNIIVSNVAFNINNIIDIKTKYDVSLYFSLIHHLLKDKNILDILNIIFNQTNYYAVIEFPIKEDKLLDIVISNSRYPENYEFLSSLGNLIDTISKYVNIKEVVRVDYSHNDNFNRYAIVCSKK